MNRQDDIKPQHEDNWLCTVDFFPSDDLEGRVFVADIVGYLFGYAQPANARTLALVGDPEAGAYEILLSFSTCRHNTGGQRQSKARPRRPNASNGAKHGMIDAQGKPAGYT